MSSQLHVWRQLSGTPYVGGNHATPWIMRNVVGAFVQ